MNMESAIEYGIGQSRIDKAHISRSKFLDAFAQLETSVVNLLSKYTDNPPSSSTPFGNKVAALKTLSPSNQLSADKLKKLVVISDEIFSLLPVRADVVHSAMSVVTCEGNDYARFCNSANTQKPFPELRLLSTNDFEELIKEVRRLSNKVNSIFNPPPPSQPQPKQGAAAGP
jgi:hypothetical protein